MSEDAIQVDWKAAAQTVVLRQRIKYLEEEAALHMERCKADMARIIELEKALEAYAEAEKIIDNLKKQQMHPNFICNCSACREFQKVMKKARKLREEVMNDTNT